MYRITKNSDETQADIIEITADLRSDVETFPDAGAGSTALVLEDSSVWVLGNDKEWHQL